MSYDAFFDEHLGEGEIWLDPLLDSCNISSRDFERILHKLSASQSRERRPRLC